MHPSVLFLAWCGVLTLTQWLSGVHALAGAALLLVLAGWCDGARLWMLVRRTRYLMLALVILFAFGTPGYLLWPQLGWASPSAEGLAAALTHIGRLLCVLALVAGLFSLMPLQKLVTALVGLGKPLEWLGVDRFRAALRLMLVLEYTASARAERSWRQWLDEPAEPSLVEIEVSTPPLARVDVFALAGLGVLIAAVWWWVIEG